MDAKLQEYTEEEQELLTRLALNGKSPVWAHKCPLCNQWGPNVGRDYACRVHFELIDWVRGWNPEVLS